MTTVAEVRMWGSRIGAVSVEDGSDVAVFQYAPDFARSGIQVAPLAMLLGDKRFSFPDLAYQSFRGLPGLLADSLPDRYGSALIDTWLEGQGRNPASFDAVERLCYIGKRGMGALEFAPSKGPRTSSANDMQVAALVELASRALAQREDLVASLARGDEEQAMRDILSVGTSAGGARAKAVIAFNPTTNQVRSGQLDTEPGFEHWLLKFDGVSGNKDKELEDPIGYGAIEFAYYKMATQAGIEMSECSMLEENGRRHFMTKRFDRVDGQKLHMQTLAALGHYDFNLAGSYSYEQALLAARRLDVGMESIEQLFRRMIFNVIARNQDDHVKNIAFLMDRSGRWHLSPAYDVTFAYNSQGVWTSRHQMTINGKRDDFVIEDLRACAQSASIKRTRVGQIVEEVQSAVEQWPIFADEAGIAEREAAVINSAHRRTLG